MSKKLKVLIAVVVVVLVLSIVGTVVVLQPSNSQWVEIVQGNEVLYTINLATAKDQDIDIEYNGSHNVVTISNGEIYVSSADCNDHTCVNMGVLKSSSLPIVCLPNRLIIRFKSEE
jgi:hypothetical protein